MLETRLEKNLGPLTQEEQMLLLAKKIFIAGCGGIGGYLLEHMVRLGIGHIICADMDVFDESNLNRQILATHSTLGQKKAEIAKRRALEINPSCTVEIVTKKLDKNNIVELIKGVDIVMEGMDNANSRFVIAEACGKTKITLAHGAASGWVAQAAIICPGKQLYEMLYMPNQHQSDGVLPFAASAAATMQAALAANYLCGRWVDALYMLDLRNMIFETIEF